MPNNITNLIIFEDSAALMKVAEAVRGDGDVLGSFDFAKLTPMPEALDIAEGEHTREALLLYTKFMEERAVSQHLPPEQRAVHIDKWRKVQRRLPGVWELGKQAYENQQNYGYPTWHSWRRANWGCKSNAYCAIPVSQDSKVLEFLTAQSQAAPIIKKLSGQFPDVRMTHCWADDDIGYNAGKAVYLGGKVVESFTPEHRSSAAYELAAEIMELDLSDFNLFPTADGTTYAYVEPDFDFELEPEPLPKRGDQER